MSLCTEWSLVKQTPDARALKLLYCRSWNCKICRPKRKAQLLALAASGEPNRFLTLTVNPHIGDSPEHRLRLLSHAWKTLVKRLRREHGSDAIQYLAVVEQTKAGEPHLHILLRSPFLAQRMLSAAMSELIDAPIVDIRKIKSTKHVVSYVAKYITKAPEQFGNAKRYWHTPKYELHQEDDDYQPIAPSGAWHIDRRYYRDILKEWLYEGFAEGIEAHGTIVMHYTGMSWLDRAPYPRAGPRDRPSS